MKFGSRLYGFVDKVLITPLLWLVTKQVTLLLVGVGVLLTFIGAAYDQNLDDFFRPGVGDFVLKSGSAIIGAGVFSAIMKSAQFTEVFQRHVFDVFYNPETFAVQDDLKAKWEKLTQAILKPILPSSHRDATAGIMAQFFNSDLQYHFENFEVTLDITLQQDGKMLQIGHKTIADVVLAPNHPAPVLRQKINVDGDCSLKSLFIDTEKIPVENHLVRDPPTSANRVFQLELGKYAKPRADGDRVLRLERIYHLLQDVTKEPYILATTERFVKGFTVKARTNSGKLFFKRTGVGNIDPVIPQEDAEGYLRWVLVPPDKLLMPGQGYILIFMKS
jgi:hypothetical protein